MGCGDLGTLGTNNASAAKGVNDSGQVVGQSWTVTCAAQENNPYGYGYWNVSSQNGFLWTSGQGMQDLEVVMLPALTLPGGRRFCE